MNRDELALEVEKILDEWDPIGILKMNEPIIYKIGVIGEYTKYAYFILEKLNSQQSINDYLIGLYTELKDNPDQTTKDEINIISNNIYILLHSV